MEYSSENIKGIFKESFKIGMEKFKANKPAQELHQIFETIQKELQEIYEYVYIFVLPEYTLNSTQRIYSIWIKHGKRQDDAQLLMFAEIIGDNIIFDLHDYVIESHYLNAFDDLSKLMNTENYFYRLTGYLKTKDN